MDRERLRDWILLPCLLAYLALLAIASIRHEIRPTALDPVHALAQNTLAGLGLRAGYNVFVDRYGSDQKLRAQCVEVRGEDARGTVGLYRSGGTCAGERFRLRLPPIEMALNRQIWEARARAIRRNPPSSTDLESEPLARIARYFCQRPEPGRGPLTQVSLLYSAYWVSYGSGRQSQVSVLTYRWSCTDEAFLARTWFPAPDEARDFWGALPWE